MEKLNCCVTCPRRGEEGHRRRRGKSRGREGWGGRELEVGGSEGKGGWGGHPRRGEGMLTVGEGRGRELFSCDVYIPITFRGETSLV